MNKKGFTLVELLVVIAIIGILAAALFPAVGRVILSARLTGTASTGRKIYQAITQTNLESKSGSIWPRTKADSGTASGEGRVDVRKTAYQNSVKYFWDVIDGAHIATPDERRPDVHLEITWLTDGVEPYSGTGEFKEENIAWTIAANVSDELKEFIPVLVTRNLDCKGLVLKYDGSTSSDLDLGKNENSSKPFGESGFVVIRMGGAADTFKSNDANVKGIFLGESFDISKRKVNGETLTYLSPWGLEPPKS